MIKICHLNHSVSMAFTFIIDAASKALFYQGLRACSKHIFCFDFSPQKFEPTTNIFFPDIHLFECFLFQNY